MVKADVKRNYYADLELPTSACIDDIRKQYRKLALQYHPDRNAGREGECVPKFQAIQAANEVLGDPLSKQKYDTDRRKAGLYPTGPTFNPRQPAPGNPYAANTNFPPPPRRTQPGGPWSRPPPPQPPGGTPGPSPSGADRFTNFPRPSPPTARKDAAQERTNTFKAWQNMSSAQERQQRFNQQQPQPTPQPQATRPRPPHPPRYDNKMPTEEQVRAGMKYRNVPRFDPEGVDKNQSAWSTFQQASAGKPGMARTTTARTPKKQGFDPNLPGSNEKPAASSHYMPRNQSADFGRAQPGIRVPPPPSGPPPPGTTPTTPHSPVSPKTQRPAVDPTRPFSSRTPNDQVPFAEGNRSRTPYSSFIREKTDLGDGLRRSCSTRDTTKLGPDEAANRGRARSTSPLRKHASDGQAQDSKQQKPFVVYSSSEASSSDPDITQHPDDGESAARPGSAPTFTARFDRPKKVPTPPSSRFNDSRNGPTSPPPVPNRPHVNGATDGAHFESDQPDMQQRATPNMYAKNSFSNPSGSITRMFGSNSTSRAKHTWSNAGSWAIPSSVNAFAKRVKSSNVVPRQDSSAERFVTAADVLFTQAPKDVQHAYLRFQAEVQKEYHYVPDNLDMELFLKLASAAQMGVMSGDARLDAVLSRVLAMPDVSQTQNNVTDDGPCANSFSFPRHHDLFTPTNAKSRSEENINTKFSPEGWSGAFMGEPDYFAPPTSAGTTRKQPSPTRRGTAKRTPSEQQRSSTVDVPPSSMPHDGASPRPWGSDGRSKDVPPQPQNATGEVRFSKEEWEKTFQDASWTFPPPPHSGSPTRSAATPGARKPSQGRRTSKATTRGTAEAKQPQVVDEADAEDVGGRPESGAAVDDGDAMDIDDTPLVQRTTTQEGHGPVQGNEKEARLYSVPPSEWRQSQEQRLKQTNGHRNTWSASTMPPGKSVSDATKLTTTLDDLRNVEPLARNVGAGAGLENFGDLSTNLPFQSQAATNLPTNLLIPQRLTIPPVPIPPTEPTKLSKASWVQYARSFGNYLVAHHNWNSTMLAHFSTREKAAEARFMNGFAWLEATGDTSGMLAAPSGFGSYLAAVKEDEPVRECWTVGCEKHAEAAKSFDKIRERVRNSAANGMLPEN
ncbi:hypothetical protein LTR37_008231 [Vermiconidia calcicola]|uniref:Uncharacterized protein n=1 Tax=Vermiconidia calcicola TaxID=1690605 RepID=A0ACC3NCB6_9PEZI|nr:hypothetical protein LTR37_008231 [Vermiconidia calcicola]